MNHVFLVEPPRFDIAQLYDKYEVEFILNGERMRDMELYYHVKEWASINFSPYDDFFVLTGNMTKVALAAMAIQAAHPTRPINLLAYDYAQQRYVKINGEGVAA